MKKKHLLLSILLLAITISSFNYKTPQVLIIGDSISLGYTPYTKKHFAEKAIISHNIGNAQHSGYGLDNIEKWIGDKEWDIIQFNWGLWDLCYRHPDSKVQGNRDKEHGNITYTPEEYAANLDSIVSILKKKTNAKLIFVTTTYVPGNEAGRFKDDAIKYNNAAKDIMKKYDIEINDIYTQSISIHNEYGQGSRNVHYTPEGYKKLSKLIIDHLEIQLKAL